MNLSCFFSVCFVLFTPNDTSCYQPGKTPSDHFNLNSQKLAISGYDATTYFTHESPKKGNKKWQVVHNGAVYHFFSSDNQKKFKDNPAKYLPKYGGWCAYAIGKNGAKVSVDPESYLIDNGALYLFYKSFFNDTRKKWLNNRFNLKSNADKHWKKIILND